jgi:lipopolysaccharide export system protein LptC
MSSPTADLSLGPLRDGGDIERRRRLLARWRRHSALIHVLRKLLPALCLLIVAVIGAWAAVNALVLSKEGGRVSGGPDIRMLNPDFRGRNDAGKPFLVRAASAVRANGDMAKVTLDHPVFTLGAPDDRTVVRAERGVYREDTHMLDLHGVVTLDDTKGDHLVTEHALVDTAKSNVTGETRIVGGGPLGRIDASSYAILDDGAVAHFAGRVRSRIEHRSSIVGQSAPKPPAP